MGVYEQINITITALLFIAIFISILTPLTKVAVAAALLLGLLLTLMPLRNVAVMMVAAPTIVNIATDIKDTVIGMSNSSTTQRIEDILNNSLKYLKNRSNRILKEE